MMEEKTLDIVLDVKVKVTVQLGSCLLPMRDVLELAPGSIVQLNQHASDPVGLYVNDKLVAYGEVVVVEDNFGIKITELVGGPSHEGDCPPCRHHAAGSPLRPRRGPDDLSSYRALGRQLRWTSRLRVQAPFSLSLR